MTVVLGRKDENPVLAHSVRLRSQQSQSGARGLEDSLRANSL